MSGLERVLEWTIEDGAPSDFLAHRSCIGVVDPELKTIATMNDVARGYSA